MTATDAGNVKLPKRFGERGDNQRYHMPLLPGEAGPKSGGDWVPWGLQSTTNLVGGFEDTRALSIWEQAMGLIGLALSPELYEEARLIVGQAESEGVNFELLRNYPELKEKLAGHAHDRMKREHSIIGRAKARAGGNAAAQRGTNQHTAWEHRAVTGELLGSEEMHALTLTTERLLAEAHLQRIPDLSERVIRNMEVKSAGRFDDMLLETTTGRLLMGDLKSKVRPFYSWLTTDAQLAVYAYAEWMLTLDGQSYEPGPKALGVDLSEGVILHVPSDGSTARLERVDLVQGWEVARVSRLVHDLRSRGKGAERMNHATWIPRLS